MRAHHRPPRCGRAPGCPACRPTGDPRASADGACRPRCLGPRVRRICGGSGAGDDAALNVARHCPAADDPRFPSRQRRERQPPRHRPVRGRRRVPRGVGPSQRTGPVQTAWRPSRGGRPAAHRPEHLADVPARRRADGRVTRRRPGRPAAGARRARGQCSNPRRSAGSRRVCQRSGLQWRTPAASHMATCVALCRRR